MTAARVRDSDSAQHPGNMMCRCGHHGAHLLRRSVSNCAKGRSACNFWPREVRRKNPRFRLTDVAPQRSHAVKSGARSNPESLRVALRADDRRPAASSRSGSCRTWGAASGTSLKTACSQAG